MPASDTTVINIIKETASLTKVGFGTLMIVAYHTKFANRSKSYGSLSELVTDGFAVTDPVYLAAQALLSQNPRVRTFKVGRRALAPTQAHIVTCTAKNSTLYTVKLNGTAFTFTSDANATDEEVAAGLVAAINLGSVPVTAADNLDGTFDLTGDVPGAIYTLEVSDGAMEGLLEVKNTTTDPGIATDLNAIVTEDDAWYGFVLDSNGQAEIEAAAAWAEARIKLFGASTADSDVLDSGASTDVASELAGDELVRTFLWWHAKPEQYIAAAIFGKLFPRIPGSITLAHKQLSGITVDKLTSGQQSTLEDKSANYYISQHGRGNTFWGYTPGGEWVDITHGNDELQSLLEQEIFGYLASNEKVEYTNQGAGGIGGVIEGVLRRKEREKFLVRDSTVVTVPDVDDPAQVSSVDKTNRLLPNVQASARYAGAVHKVNLDVRLSV
jgi:hypothetical protein